MDRSRLRFALRWAGLSQAQAARAAGIHTQRITDALAGRRRLPEAQVRRLAGVLAVEAAWLVDAPKAIDAAPTPAPAHPVTGMMRPVQASLMVVTWGELLVLWRSLHNRNQSGAAVEAEVADGLMQRLVQLSGMDAEALRAAAGLVDQIARLG
jgi:hypothetical protein